MTFLQFFKKSRIKQINQIIKKNRRINLFILSIVFFFIIFLYFYSTVSPKSYNLMIGQVAPRDIRSPMDIEDKEATAKLIEKAIESVEPKEKIDPTIQIDVKKMIEKFFKILYEIRKKDNIIYTEVQQSIESLNEYNEFNLSKEDLLLLLKSDEKNIQSLESYVYEVVLEVMSTGIKKRELDEERKKIEEYFMGLDSFNEKFKKIAINIVNSSIKENTFLDKESTQEKINEAIKKVDKVYIKKGQIIVNEGEEINEKQYKLLKAVGLINENRKKEIIPYIGAALIILLLELVIFFYIYLFDKKLFTSITNFYLIALVLLIVLLISKSLNNISSYLIPVATSSMLIGILINPILAIVLNIFLSVLIILVTGSNLSVFLTLLIGGTVAAISTSNTHQRANIFISGIIVSFTNIIIVFSYGFIYGIEMKKILVNGFYGVVNGLLCSILTIGSLPLWEYIFNKLTPIKLLELSNPNQKILKRLLVEAPGTYHHSIIVGNLSEAAAQAIGCNGLLARVGSYYHDIGKLKRPYFFKENQLTFENPHDKITSSLSSNIIRSHVKDGVQLALEHNLPKEIIDIIEQHHGTTLVKYFYHKALNEKKNSSDVDIDDFAYHGPKPQTKEAAIVMLADSVEAAVRSMTEPTKENIKKLVIKIIEDKIEQGQLTDCNLTFKDIETINTIFVNILMGIFHERIEYPEVKQKKLEVSN